MNDQTSTGRHDVNSKSAGRHEVTHYYAVDEPVKKKGLSKKTLYLLTAIAAAALLMSVAVIIRNVNDGREYTKYYTQAISAYDCGDYNTALSHLRKAYSKSRTDECVLFMADCYEAQKNYEKALEMLENVGKRSREAAERIERIEQKRGQSANVEKVTVAGKEYPVNTVGIVLDDMHLGDGVLNELTQLYALSNLSAAGNELTELSPVSRLGGLTTLNVNNNHITDISPLSALSNLRTLYLDNNPISDFSPLYVLTGLTTLSIKNVKITDTQLSELSAALPNCAIHSEEVTKSITDITLGGVTFKSNVTELNLSGLGIRDISALADCRSLNRLDLSGNNISDLSPLMDIPGLMWLNVSSNNVTDLSPLMGISSILTLDVSGNHVLSTAPLSMMTGLVELHLENNSLKNFSGLRNLYNLETLGLTAVGLTDGDLAYLNDLGSLRLLNIEDNPELTGDGVSELQEHIPYCSIRHSELSISVSFGDAHYRADTDYIDISGLGLTDIGDIMHLTALQTAYLGNNSINDLTPLQNLTSLRSVDLSDNEVYDVSPLWELTQLEYLDLSGNRIDNVLPLMGMSGLRSLDLSGNPLDEEQIRELQQALPDCVIYY